MASTSKRRNVMTSVMIASDTFRKKVTLIILSFPILGNGMASTEDDEWYLTAYDSGKVTGSSPDRTYFS